MKCREVKWSEEERRGMAKELFACLPPLKAENAERFALGLHWCHKGGYRFDNDALLRIQRCIRNELLLAEFKSLRRLCFKEFLIVSEGI